MGKVAAVSDVANVLAKRFPKATRVGFVKAWQNRAHSTDASTADDWAIAFTKRATVGDKLGRHRVGEAFKRAKLEKKEAISFYLDREFLAVGLPFFPEEAWNEADKALNEKLTKAKRDVAMLKAQAKTETETIADVSAQIGLAQDFDDEELADYAKRCAADLKHLNANGYAYKTAPTAHDMDVMSYLHSHDMAVPAGDTSKSVWLRLQDPAWWRRRLRSGMNLKLEKSAIDLGLISKRKQIYTSDDGVARRLLSKKRLAAALEMTILENELGESFNLKELADKSTANPAIRQVELIKRIVGFDQIAQDLGHAGEFVTLTAPSRFHARLAASGESNPKYAGAYPRETQDYLCKTWARIRAELARTGIKVYGFRIAEPHHDATPHWHLLLFMPMADVKTFRAIVAKHAVREDRREDFGLDYALTKTEAKRLAATKKEVVLTEAAFWQTAPKHIWKEVSPRILFKAIDRQQGSAAGYLIKYICKNVTGKRTDGSDVGVDFEGNGESLAMTAERVEAWASAHHIRQFQQIGGAPVTLWRECRRVKDESLELDGELEEVDSLVLRAAHAAQSDDWAKFTNIMGGWDLRRKDLPLKIHTQIKMDSEGLPVKNKYEENAAPATKGLADLTTGEVVITRIHEWTKVSLNAKSDGLEAPSPTADAIDFLAPTADEETWTRINNCTKDTIVKNEAESIWHNESDFNLMPDVPDWFDFGDFVGFGDIDSHAHSYA